MGFFNKKTKKNDFAEQHKEFEANFVVHDDEKEYDENDGIKGVDSVVDSFNTSFAVNSAIEIGARTLVTGALTANAVYHSIQIAKTLKANESLNPFNVVMAGVSTLAGIIEAKSTVDTIKTVHTTKKALDAAVQLIQL